MRFLTSICSVDLLLSEWQPGPVSGPGGFDTLEGQTGLGTFGDWGPLLKVLEGQTATRGPHDLPPVGTGVVRQASSVCDTLNHCDVWAVRSTGRTLLIWLLHTWLDFTFGHVTQAYRSSTHGSDFRAQNVHHMKISKLKTVLATPQQKRQKVQQSQQKVPN